MKPTSMILAAFLVGAPCAPGLESALAAGRAQSSAVHAAVAEQTQVFTVEKMTCATCPIAVKAAMEAVKGVTSARVDFTAKQATVVFDPAVTTPQRIADASTKAGFPASPKA